MKNYKKHELKNEGEKLIKIFLKENKGKIDKIIISGDFFIIPEEGIDLIESNLIGIELNKNSICTCIDTVIKQNNISLIGISSMSIVQGILEASKK